MLTICEYLVINQKHITLYSLYRDFEVVFLYLNKTNLLILKLILNFTCCIVYIVTDSLYFLY